MIGLLAFVGAASIIGAVAVCVILYLANIDRGIR